VLLKELRLNRQLLRLFLSFQFLCKNSEIFHLRCHPQMQIDRLVLRLKVASYLLCKYRIEFGHRCLQLVLNQKEMRSLFVWGQRERLFAVILAR